MAFMCSTRSDGDGYDMVSSRWSDVDRSTSGLGSMLLSSSGTPFFNAALQQRQFEASQSQHDALAALQRSVTPQRTASKAAPAPPRKVGMVKELFGDLRGYVRDNRDLIFSIVFVLVLDEYVFKGAFRERIKSVIEGVLKKVEDKTGIDIPGV